MVSLEILQEDYGKIDGRTITAFTMVNDHGMEITCLDYGCIITKIVASDRNGHFENIVLGFDCIEEYQKYSPYFGAIIGRFAGRIKNAEFNLNGKTYQLAKNNNDNHLHGGFQGFDKVSWETKIAIEADSTKLEFTYLSKSGEEGYPGNLLMKVTYTLNNKNELIISYKGVSDESTLLNVTNHTYFNLSGNLKRDILDHQLTIKSRKFVELDERLIPTGKILSVENTPFDFQNGRKIKDGMTSGHVQNWIAGNGYDHPFLLTEQHKKEITLLDEESGRELIIETDEPAVVLYTGNQLEADESYSIRGVPSRNYLGLCLETQGLPDSIHNPHFPSSILKKGEVFQSVTKYKFGIKS